MEFCKNKKLIELLVNELQYSWSWKFFLLTFSKKRNYALRNGLTCSEKKYSYTHVLVGYDYSNTILITFLDLEKRTVNSYYMTWRYFNNIIKNHLFGEEENFFIELFNSDEVEPYRENEIVEHLESF